MLALAKLISAVIVPDVVTGVEPMVRVELEEDNPTDVTVPAFWVRQVEPMEKQPPVRFTPPVDE